MTWETFYVSRLQSSETCYSSYKRVMTVIEKCSLFFIQSEQNMLKTTQNISVHPPVEGNVVHRQVNDPNLYVKKHTQDEPYPNKETTWTIESQMYVYKISFRSNSHSKCATFT